MPKIEVPFDQYLREATLALSRDGALLVSLDESGRPNPMTIGWATAGVIWGTLSAALGGIFRRWAIWFG